MATKRKEGPFETWSEVPVEKKEKLAPGTLVLNKLGCRQSSAYFVGPDGNRVPAKKTKQGFSVPSAISGLFDDPVSEYLNRDYVTHVVMTLDHPYVIQHIGDLKSVVDGSFLYFDYEDQMFHFPLLDYPSQEPSYLRYDPKRSSVANVREFVRKKKLQHRFDNLPIPVSTCTVCDTKIVKDLLPRSKINMPLCRNCQYCSACLQSLDDESVAFFPSGKYLCGTCVQDIPQSFED